MDQPVEKIRVLVVDYVSQERQRILEILRPCEDILIVGEADSRTEALAKIQVLQPHLVTIHISISEKYGFDAIEEIMAYYPTPILALTNKSLDEKDAWSVLELGALHLLTKPLSALEKDTFIQQIRLLAKIPVIRHVQGKHRKTDRNRFMEHLKARKKYEKNILIGCSAGGPTALLTLLKGLSPTLAAPILVVQHIPLGFSKSLAQWLQENTLWTVREAQEEDALREGTVLIAPGGYNLTFTLDAKIHLEKDTSSPFCPSINLMMFSAVQIFKQNSIGILLTGIGEDGAEGLLALKECGGYTIVEDASTCLVFGMPKKAIELGAAKEVLPCYQIAPRLTQILEHLPSVSRI